MEITNTDELQNIVPPTNPCSAEEPREMNDPFVKPFQFDEYEFIQVLSKSDKERSLW
jgi:hypothetical protein